MIDRRALLGILSKYENELANGILPDDLANALTQHIVYSHLVDSPHRHRIAGGVTQE